MVLLLSDTETGSPVPRAVFPVSPLDLGVSLTRTQMLALPLTSLG